ncbi:MAG: tRNA pseudouridine(13) synthase TruD [Granulosicoccaceae bacterium]|jgi:tRNA pseudouridine13 synthase
MAVDQEILTLALNPARALGKPCGSGRLRTRPEDFVVDEIPLAAPQGQGEHVWLKIRKTNSNTDWIAGQLARVADVPRKHVSYAGRKDRYAVTTQWFSVHLPGKADPDWSLLNNDEVEVLEAQRHSRKLKRGALLGNRFRLRIQQLDAERHELEERLGKIAAHGVPNYFGAQRFGREASNLEQALQLFGGKRMSRSQREMAISAARSLLFNAILDARVRAGTWSVPCVGDICLRDGRHGFFSVDEVNEELLQRLHSGEIHIAATMWGKQGHQPEGEAAEIEAQALAGLQDWCKGLERCGLDSDRRALRMNVSQLDWSIEADCLEVSFELVAGCFATTALRECLDVYEAGRES